MQIRVEVDRDNETLTVWNDGTEAVNVKLYPGAVYPLKPGCCAVAGFDWLRKHGKYEL